MLNVLANRAGLRVQQSMTPEPILMRDVLTKSLTIRGFIQREFHAQRPDFYREMAQWIAEGRVKYQEDIVDGLASAPEAFIGMLEGRNFGKLIVQVS